ncbi:MAG: 16S rRNA (cytosine(967)-C(5))-methyltransferase RsmB, partial [Gammaproteobacteria bacterium]
IYGVCRYYLPLKGIIESKLRKPLKSKDRDIFIILMLGAFQILQTHKPAHAIVNATSELARQRRKEWAVALINGTLRNLVREKEKDAAIWARANASPESAFPAWITRRIQHAYPTPSIANAILSNSLIPAPMTLRYNPRWNTLSHFTDTLSKANITGHWSQHIPNCLTLSEPITIENIPDFYAGSCSVQDEAAQLAAHLLNPTAHARVLDACAAPGGKTCHLLELGTKLQLTALDSSATRLRGVQQNLDRLGLHATLIAADATDVNSWWDRVQFDYILLDAPCTSLGVIRRHPDIFWLKHEIDVAKLAKLQETLLNCLWPTLKPGGTLLYSTCSLLPEENESQIHAFLQQHPDASTVDLSEYKKRYFFATDPSTEPKHGLQLIPQAGGNDGFYYACLHKAPEAK